MPTEGLAIVGAGGHAKVVVDALLLLGWRSASLEIYSENRNEVGQDFSDHTVRYLSIADLEGRQFHVAIGSNTARHRISDAICKAGGSPLSVIHPRAIVSTTSRIGTGSFVAAGAIIGPDAILGAGCIANHSSVIDHDCRVHNYVHIAPGATLGGGVTLMADVLVGAGANVLPRITVGSATRIGAGAVVHRDIPADSTYVGVPARQIQESRT